MLYILSGLFWNDDKRTLLFLHLKGFFWYWVYPPGTALEAGFYSGYCILMKYYYLTWQLSISITQRSQSFKGRIA